MKKQSIISGEYFYSHLNKSIKLAGPRYSSDYNVNIPFSDVFDALCRTEVFYLEIRKLTGIIIKESALTSEEFYSAGTVAELITLKEGLKTLLMLLQDIKEYNSEPINWKSISTQTENLESQIWNLSDQLKEFSEILAPEVNHKKDGSYSPTKKDKISSLLYHLRNLREAINEINSIASSNKAYLSNYPYLLLTGEAGMGKTHLLCDVMSKRIANGVDIKPTFITFGEQYAYDTDLIDNLVHLLSLSDIFKSSEKFLAFIDRLAFQHRSRSLIIIDALNECSIPNYWKKRLSAFIKDLTKFKNIALVVSIRSGFESIILSKTQLESFTRINHTGFYKVEWESMSKYFGAFGLPMPEIPYFYPEFQNPLFLLLFCKAFSKRGRLKAKQAFRGHEGTTYVFEHFVDNISKKLLKKYVAIYSFRGDIWNSLIKPVAEIMVDNLTDRISERDFCNIIKHCMTIDNPHIVIQDLEREFLISRYPETSSSSGVQDIAIKFPFQKFSDNLISRYVFKKYIEEFGAANKNIITAKRFFSKRRKLGRNLSQYWGFNIVEALSIQCPEHLNGIEFIEVAPYLLKDRRTMHYTIEAFVESLIWRRCNAFRDNLDNTLKIVNKYILKDENTSYMFWDALLTVAPVKEHPFNAELLDSHLMKFTMAARDSWWSIYLHKRYQAKTALDRIIEWAITTRNFDNLSDKAIMLSAVTVCWFLTTPNRFVRDKATKALVNLLRNRITLLLPLLKHFEGINDVYIKERIYAVTYSCSLLNKKDVVSLKALAVYVYKYMFHNNPPTTHILIRDYARGIIEVALSQISISKIDQSKIFPPYRSNWSADIPTKEELKVKYLPNIDESDKPLNREYASIWFSVLGGGDFDRYVIGTNSGGRSHYWSGKRIGDQNKSIKDIYQIFQKSLTKKQKSIWELYRLLKHEEVLNILRGKDNNNGLLEYRKEDLIEAFEASLSKVKKAIYEEFIKPHLDDNQLDEDPHEYFDLSIAQRWIFNRVIELGYDPKKHYEFDDFVNRYYNSGRSEHKAERIGKKYQWIAYHEFMGLVADNFQFRHDQWDNKAGMYQGPWIPHIRDIDPTFLINNDEHIKKSISVSNWLSQCVYIVNKWYDVKPDKEWMKIRRDLPDPLKLIELQDDHTDYWLLLNGIFDWDKPIPPEIDKFDVPRRNIWYTIKSYLVHNSDISELKKWGQQQRFMGRWMPESPESGDFYKIFLAEYPYSYAYDCIQDEDDDWRTDTRKKRQLSFPVLVTDNNYLNEYTLDCSSDRNSARISLPCATIIKEMQLVHAYNDGRFYQDEILACTPLKIFNETLPDCLLFNKELLSKYLQEHDYSIIWTFIGEKRILTMSGNSLGLLEMNGFYWFSGNEEIQGSYKTRFVEYLY